MSVAQSNLYNITVIIWNDASKWKWCFNCFSYLGW